MRVKRFIGENVAETMGKVKRELGSDAVILQTRQFREGGLFGLFGKLKVEITAAIEEQHPSKKITPPLKNPYAVEGPDGIAAGKTAGLSFNPRSDKYSGSLNAVNPDIQVNTFPDRIPSETVNLQQELSQMRQTLEQMTKQMADLGNEKIVWPSSLQKWALILRERGLAESLIKRLLRQIQQTLPEEKWTDEEKVFGCLWGAIRKLCYRTEAIQPGINKPQVVALVGPTGVGKTTTIGKLAAGFSIVDKRKVALITADTYRVAAVEQLKTFGEIIGVAVEVAMTPSGLREALLQHADKELIFIDTAGRSPHHDMHMSELRAFLDKAKPDQTLLVMSATTQTSDQLKVFERFEPLTTHLIFTKLDETESGGAILNLLEKTSLPTAYLTNGQNVPDDIESATPDRLADYILGEGMPHA